MSTTRRSFIKLAASLPFGFKAVIDASTTNLKIKSNEKLNDLSKFRGKNVEILYLPSVGETLPSIYIRDKEKPTINIEIDLLSEPGNKLQEEVVKILTALKNVQPESITFDEKKSPLAQARDSYDLSAIGAMQKNLHKPTGAHLIK
jgi:hypothetical protein